MTFVSWSLTGLKKTCDANDDDHQRDKARTGLFNLPLKIFSCTSLIIDTVHHFIRPSEG